MSLCFDEAFEALRQSRISEEEYLHQVLAHFCGARHPADERRRSWEVMIKDPLGNAIRDAALNCPQRSTQSLGDMESLFASALRDDALAVRKIVTYLESCKNQPIPLQAVATFAALHNDAEVLRLCLQLGASLNDRNTSLALEYTERGPALLDVLYENDWRDMRTSTLAFNRMLEWSLHTNPAELTWFLSHDGKVDQDTIRRAIRGAPVKATCIAVLAGRFGADLFKGTGLLQSAAKRGRTDVVRILLDAGMDVDELLVPSPNHEGECELTALYEAVYKQHEDTVRLLLSHGADPEKQVCDCDNDLHTPLKLAEAHDYSKIASLLRHHVDKGSSGDRILSARL